jgi:hypothetical protein
LIGGIGNWAHGSVTFAISNLPKSYQTYIQFTFYSFYDFNAADKEGFSAYVNGLSLATNVYISPTLTSGKILYFNIFDLDDSATINIQCISTTTPYEQSCGISDLFILPLKVNASIIIF